MSIAQSSFFAQRNTNVHNNLLLKPCVIFSDIVGPIPLKSRLNHYEVSQMIMNIWDHFKLNGVHDQLSQGATSSSMASPFSKYILEGDQCMKKTIYFDEQKYQQILSETFDVVESEDFQMVLAECVKECLQRVLHSIEHHFQNNLSGLCMFIYIWLATRFFT